MTTEELTHLYTVHDTYNHLKERRDNTRALLEAMDRNPVDSNETNTSYNTHAIYEQFLTDALAMIDRGRGMPTEDDL